MFSSLPISLPLTLSLFLTIFPHTNGSLYTLGKHPSFLLCGGRILSFISFNPLLLSFSFLTPVDPILKLQPICFISSWWSWQGPFCWRTTLSTQTRSPCTFRASSALTKPTPSRTRDQRTTARRRLFSSTPSSPPSPLWRWVCVQLVKRKKEKQENIPTGAHHAHLTCTDLTIAYIHAPTGNTDTGEFLLICTWCLWIKRGECV